MPRTPPVSRWDTDFDVLDDGYISNPFEIWDELPSGMPDSPYRQAWEQLAADVLRGRHRDRARLRALQLARSRSHPLRGRAAARGGAGSPLRAAADLGRPASAHMDETPSAALVLPPPGGDLRATDTGALPFDDRRVHRRRACGRGRGVRGTGARSCDRGCARRSGRPRRHLHRLGARRARVRRRRRASVPGHGRADQLLPPRDGSPQEEPGHGPPERAAAH